MIGGLEMTSLLPGQSNWISICLLYLMSVADKSWPNLLLNPADKAVNPETSTQSNAFGCKKSQT